MLFDTARSTASARSTRATPSPTSTTRRSSARSPSTPPSLTSSTATQGQPGRHARLQHLHHRGRTGHARRRRGAADGLGGGRAPRCRPRSCGRSAAEIGHARCCSSSTSWTASAPPASGHSMQLQKKFGREVVPLQLPIGEEAAFCRRGRPGDRKGLHLGPRTRAARSPSAEPPADLDDEVETAREALVEMVAEQDENLIERFFAERRARRRRAPPGLAKAVAGARACSRSSATAGRQEHGLQPLMDALVELAPPPDWRPVTVRSADGEHAPRSRSTAHDPAVGVRLQDLLRPLRRPHHACCGCSPAPSTRTPRSPTPSATSRERLGRLDWMQGKELSQVAKLHAGDIGAVRQAQGDPHRRHPLRRRRAVVLPAGADPGGRDQLRHRPQGQGRRGQDRAARWLSSRTRTRPSSRP